MCSAMFLELQGSRILKGGVLCPHQNKSSRNKLLGAILDGFAKAQSWILENKGGISSASLPRGQEGCELQGSPI